MIAHSSQHDNECNTVPWHAHQYTHCKTYPPKSALFPPLSRPPTLPCNPRIQQCSTTNLLLPCPQLCACDTRNLERGPMQAGGQPGGQAGAHRPSLPARGSGCTLGRLVSSQRQLSSCGAALIPAVHVVVGVGAPKARVLLDPLVHLVESVHDGLARAVAVRLVRQQHQPARGAVALERMVVALRLQRERARVVVVLAVDEQQRARHLVGRHEGRHARVHVRRLPQRALLVLEPKRRERAVERAGARDAACKGAGRVRHQVGGHERAVRVAAHGHALGVHDAAPHALVHARLRAGRELLQEGVVGLLLPLRHDGQRGAVQHRVAARHPQRGRRRPDGRELVGRPPHLARGVLGLELARVRPEHAGQRAVARRVVAGGRVQRGGEHDAVVARVAQHLALHVAQRGVGVRVVGDLALRQALAAVRQRDDVRLRRVLGALAREQQLQPLQRHRLGVVQVIHDGARLLVEGRGGLPQAGCGAAAQVQQVQEGAVALGGGACALHEQLPLAVHLGQHVGAPLGAARQR
mmetsp:Transcript_38188/g.96676  ORF Transcript_38188/g.96676 Transcript_38188/m.96676 type:complete len:523 (-) Transcript_38188:1676-3244(-)